MDEPTIIKKIALAVFKDGKVLMVRTFKNEKVFYTLGGKVEGKESDIECLNREVKEEVGVTIIPHSIKYLREFEAPAYGRENTRVNVKLYQGELANEPKPSSEVEEIRYFDSTIGEEYLTPLTVSIFSWLKSEKLIS